MKFPKWSFLSFLAVVFFPINLWATQELPSDYQSAKIVSVQTTEWQTEYVVQISVQVKEMVYTGEYVTEEKSMAPPSGVITISPSR